MGESAVEGSKAVFGKDSKIMIANDFVGRAYSREDPET